MEQRAKVMGKAGAAAVYRSFINSMKEDAPVNVVGGGQIAGLGVGPQGEPGIKRKKKVATAYFSQSQNQLDTTKTGKRHLK